MEQFPDYHFHAPGVTIHINMKRPNENLKRAQMWLETQIMNDMLPLMPLRDGFLQQVTRARNAVLLGSGKVWAAAPIPYGRYQYYGKVMVDAETGRGPMKIPDKSGGYILRFRPGTKLKATNRDLTYSQPGAMARWFEVAKAEKLDNWKKGVEKKLNER